MGYANIPNAVGWGLGSYLSGKLYGQTGEKASLALRYLSENLQVKELPDRSQALATLTQRLGGTPEQVTRLLWDRYDPSYSWTLFAIAGGLGAVAMYFFISRARRWERFNV